MSRTCLGLRTPGAGRARVFDRGVPGYGMGARALRASRTAGGSRNGDDDANSGNVSQQPVDRLLRTVMQTGWVVRPEEVEQILDCIAAAPFDPRIVAVRLKLRGRTYQGRTLGARERSLFVAARHLGSAARRGSSSHSSLAGAGRRTPDQGRRPASATPGGAGAAGAGLL